MEANLNHPFFDFSAIMNSIRGGAFEENSLWYTSTVKLEEKGLPYFTYKKKELFWNYIENIEVIRKDEMLKSKVSLFLIPS